MKVVHINTTVNGGAARAAIRLHHALLNRGIDSVFLHLRKGNVNIKKAINYSKINQQDSGRIFLNKVLNKTGLKKHLILKQKDEIERLQKLGKFDIFSFPVSEYRVHQLNVLEQADIIHLHWIPNFIDWASFFKKVNKPVVWTFHDRNPMLGGVHLEDDLVRNSDAFLKIDNKYKAIKRKAIQTKNNLYIVSPSKSLAKRVKQDEVFGRFDVKIIPNSVDEDIFKPINQDHLKRNLGFDEDDILITFVGSTAHHKGFDLLIEAIKDIQFKRVKFLIVGVEEKKANIKPLPNLIFMGHINDDGYLVQIYNASSAIIITSREDNLPNVMLESFFCGTPVLSVPVGGMKDTIIDGFNGFLSKDLTIESIVEVINKFLNNIEVFKRDLIVKYANETFSKEKQVEAYINLYNQILNALQLH